MNDPSDSKHGYVLDLAVKVIGDEGGIRDAGVECSCGAGKTFSSTADTVWWLVEHVREHAQRATQDAGPMIDPAELLSPTEARLRPELLASVRDGLRHNAMLLALAHHGDEAAAVRSIVVRLM